MGNGSNCSKKSCRTSEMLRCLRQGDANVAFAMQSLDKAAPELGVTLTRFGLRPDDDLAAKFRQMEQSDAEGLIVIAGALTYVKSKEIAE